MITESLGKEQRCKMMGTHVLFSGQTTSEAGNFHLSFPRTIPWELKCIMRVNDETSNKQFSGKESGRRNILLFQNLTTTYDYTTANSD